RPPSLPAFRSGGREDERASAFYAALALVTATTFFTPRTVMAALVADVRRARGRSSLNLRVTTPLADSVPILKPSEPILLTSTRRTLVERTESLTSASVSPATTPTLLGFSTLASRRTSFCTLFTPETDLATVWASSRVSRLLTVPVRVTAPAAESTSMFRLSLPSLSSKASLTFRVVVQSDLFSAAIAAWAPSSTMPSRATFERVFNDMGNRPFWNGLQGTG